jgi:hypothetical protein
MFNICEYAIIFSYLVRSYTIKFYINYITQATLLQILHESKASDCGPYYLMKYIEPQI